MDAPIHTGTISEADADALIAAPIVIMDKRKCTFQEALNVYICTVSDCAYVIKTIDDIVRRRI